MSEPAGWRVEVGHVGARPLLTPHGAITFETAHPLEEACALAAPGHGTEVLLDFRSVPLMDSAALEALLAMHEGLESRGGRLTLIHVNEVCADILKATRLNNVLHVQASLEQATGGG